jgi:pimeloyl-ACP methyl ester carboxylesterase
MLPTIERLDRALAIVVRGAPTPRTVHLFGGSKLRDLLSPRELPTAGLPGQPSRPSRSPGPAPVSRSGKTAVAIGTGDRRRSRSNVTERTIEANDVELCTESFGEPAHPPILLIMGMSGSMLWWEEGFCRMLSEGGRFVIRYDHRDTGRSVTYEPGLPGYTGADLVADAAGVLDAYGISAAHVVGVSMGGALAQLLALDFADRVLSLVLISTSRAVPGERRLPPPTEELAGFTATTKVDWSDRASVIEYLVDYSRVLAGGRRPFDEAAVRELARREVERARNFAAAQNHEVLADDERSRVPLSSITVPTLVIHGTADPLFPLEHGRALAEEIPGARLMRLEGAGHGVDRADWDTVAQAILNHTSIDGTR